MKTLTAHSNRLTGRSHANEALADLLQSLTSSYSAAEIRQYVECRIGGLLRLAGAELAPTDENDAQLKLQFTLEKLSTASRSAIEQSVKTILNDMYYTVTDSAPAPKMKVSSRVTLVSSGIDQVAEQPQEKAETNPVATDMTPELASALAHKLRNYLAAIMSAGEQLEETISGNDADDSVQLTKLISRAAQDQRMLIDRFLQAFGPIKIRNQKVNLDHLIRTSLEQLRQRYGYSISSDGNDALLCGFIDTDLLARIVVELAANAAEAAPQGNAAVHWHARDGRLVIRVSNNTAVVPDEMYGTFLQPFFTSKPGHTGLGLNIALRSAEALGGTVRSILLQDRTTMTVSIPFQIEDSTNLHTERNF